MMSNSRIPSPARSLGVISTPRQYKQRRSRSVCSPGRVENIKLTTMITDFVPSPLPNRRSVLNDNTEIIDMPQRKSWWRKLDENSRDVMELFEHKDVLETNNIEENFDVEILSQEKKNYTLDLPESSDGESISSIVIPQRKLFTQKENHPPKKFPRVFNNREELVKLQKSHVDHDNEIDVRPKSLFSKAKKPKTKPIFPSALLNISANKSIANKTREIPNVEPKGQVRNLFGNRPGTKRKNMFAEFVVSESEDEVPEIQVKVFGFQRKSEQKHRVSARGVENSPTTSILDVDIDDWKQLPSSTMMENQIEDLAATPSKRTRLSRLIEPQETMSTNKELNKTKRNESLRSHKSKLSTSSTNVEEMEINDYETQKHPSLNKTRTDAQFNKVNKTYDAANRTENIQNKSSKLTNVAIGKEHTKVNASKSTDNYENNQEPIQRESDGENDFILEYENDEDNVEQVENNTNKIEENITENPLDEIQPEVENKSFVPDLSAQAKIAKDNKSKNRSNFSIIKTTNIDETQNYNVGNNHNTSLGGFVSNEINKTKESTLKNQTFETNEEIVKEKSVNNNSFHKESQVNKSTINNVSHNKSLIIQNYDNVENDTNKIKSINEASKSSFGSIHDDENIEQSEQEPDNNDDEDNQNEDTSEESIQLDESETLNKDQEEEENESSNEINETEKDTSENVICSNAKEVEQVIDEVDNVCQNDEILNKTNTNIEKSKINESKVDPPEAILFQQSKNLIESFTRKDDGKSPRKTKSMLKNNLRPSLAPVRESTGFSDNTANSSGANSGWDSHRTTRKTLRKTFGKDFTPRKSLRTLVMEKSAKQRQTFNPDLRDISKHLRANSTELPGHGMNEPQEEFNDETIENIQQAIENNVVVKETPEGTHNDIADDDLMETEETNVNRTQERSKVAERQMQSEESDNENLEKSDVEASDHENDARKSKQAEGSDSENENSDASVSEREESDHANDTGSKQIEKENDNEDENSDVEDSDHENDATENQESDHATDTSNQQMEEESDHANDTSNKEETEDEMNDLENDSSNNQIEDEIEHANDTSNQHIDEETSHANNTSDQQTDQESDNDVNMIDADNQEVEDSYQESDNDTRDNQAEESEYNEISENKENTNMEQTAEETNHFSKSMKQRTLEMYLEKINKQEAERKKKLRENLMNTLKSNTHNFKVPAIPTRRNIKPVQKKPQIPPKTMEVDDLPEEVKQDLKYKPPRRYQPKNASWATMRLYKYLETKLEPKYDYMARVRAEKLVNTLHEFVRHIRRHETAPAHLVTALKHEMARLKIVDTHYEFYHFFHEFMPREIRVKVNPDIVNRIQMPRDVFANIIRQ